MFHRIKPPRKTFSKAALLLSALSLVLFAGGPSGADIGEGPAAPGNAVGRPAPRDPIYRTDSIASERRNAVMFLAKSPHYFLSAGKAVPLRDGTCSNGSIRIDMDRVAFGNLDEDAFQEAAVSRRPPSERA